MKPLSEMTDEEVYAHIKQLREIREAKAKEKEDAFIKKMAEKSERKTNTLNVNDLMKGLEDLEESE